MLFAPPLTNMNCQPVRNTVPTLYTSCVTEVHDVVCSRSISNLNNQLIGTYWLILTQLYWVTVVKCWKVCLCLSDLSEWLQNTDNIHKHTSLSMVSPSVLPCYVSNIFVYTHTTYTLATRCVWTHSGVGLSRSLCTGMISWPRNRLMIGRLLANLSFTSISNTSVIRATKVYFYRHNDKKGVVLFSPLVLRQLDILHILLLKQCIQVCTVYLDIHLFPLTHFILWFCFLTSGIYHWQQWTQNADQFQNLAVKS